MISIASPIIGPEETAAVHEVLASGMLAQGPKVAALEEAFAAYCGTKYAAAVNSGTAALHAALFAAGVGKGDEVITTAFSFMGTVNPILMVGAKPVLVDIDHGTFNIDPILVEKAITPRTKAIIPVHLYGQPVDMDKLQALAKKHKLVLIEDACQAVGADFRGMKAGALGDMGCFSFYATKNIMAGEGGMVTTNNKKLIDAVKRFRQHGMSSTYEYVHAGYNYRMSDLHAAIALEQLKKLDSFSEARQRNVAALSAGLRGITGLELPVTAADRTHVFHQFTVRIREAFRISRDAFVAAMREQGVGVGVYYPKPLHAYDHVAAEGYGVGDFPMSELASQEVVSLPVHPLVSKDDVATIIAAVKDIAHVGRS